jgi:hypothetical protein
MPAPAENTLQPQQHSLKEASNDKNYQTLCPKSVQYKSNKRLFAAHLWWPL